MDENISPEDARNECLTIAEGFCEAMEEENLVAAQMLYDILVMSEWANLIDGERYRDAMGKFNRIFQAR